MLATAGTRGNNLNAHYIVWTVTVALVTAEKYLTTNTSVYQIQQEGKVATTQTKTIGGGGGSELHLHYPNSTDLKKKNTLPGG